MMQWQGERRTIIRSLRVRTSSSDPQATRLRVAHALNAADLNPPALPPSAILCVRRLVDPRPGGVDARQAGVRPDLNWERAVQSALARLARDAARPALGFVPLSAEAVLFNDRSELLACLATDWLDGSLADRWWWQSMISRTELDQALLDAWLSAPDHLPAAFERLAQAGRAVPFAQKLGESQAHRLLASLVSFHAPALAPILTIVLSAGLPDPSLAQQEPPPAQPIAPPWKAWAPEAVNPALRLPQTLLLGIGLGLGRDPQAVHSSAFSAALRSWFSSQTDLFKRSAQAPAHSPPDRDEASLRPAEEANPLPARGVSDLSLLPAADSAIRGATQKIKGMKQAQGQAANPQTPPALPRQARAHAKSPVRRRAVIPAAPSTGGDPAQALLPMIQLERDAPPQSRLAEKARPLLLEETIESEYAGVFYLINLGIALGFYGDFTTPGNPGIDLPIWDFIALLARGLLGPLVEADPVWHLLQRLAGRKLRQPSGLTFKPADAWILPPEWLEAFPEPGEWHWSMRGGRLRVSHPAGFLVLDLQIPESVKQALGTEKRAWVRSFLQPYGEIRTLRQAKIISRGGRRPVARWLACLLPYVSARLAQALSHEISGMLPAQLALQQHGWAQVSPARLDVLLSLADLPVEVRLSGLDRDPGWVPAAGRSVAFHYE